MLDSMPNSLIKFGICSYMKWKAGDFMKNFCDAIPSLIHLWSDIATSFDWRGWPWFMKEIYR